MDAMHENTQSPRLKERERSQGLPIPKGVYYRLVVPVEQGSTKCPKSSAHLSDIINFPNTWWSIISSRESRPSVVSCINYFGNTPS